MEDAIKKLEEAQKGETPSTPSSQSKSFMGMYRNMEKKSLYEESATAGGFLVPDEFSKELIQVVRSASVVMPRASIYTMNTDTLLLPKITTGSSTYWEQTGGFTAKTDTDQVFGQITLSAKTAYGLTRISEQLAEDSSPDAVQSVQKDLAAAIMANVEKAFLEGAGTGADPIMGVKNQAGVGTAPQGASLTADDLIDALTNVENAGFAPNGIILYPADKAALRKLKDADGRYLWSDPRADEAPTVFGVPVFSTRNMTSTAGSRTIYVGQWDEAAVGMRRDLTLAVSKDRYFEFDQIGIRLALRVAFAVRNAGAFSIITSVG